MYLGHYVVHWSIHFIQCVICLRSSPTSSSTIKQWATTLWSNIGSMPLHEATLLHVWDHSCSFILQELAGCAREGKLKPHEYQGGSFMLEDGDKTASPRLSPGVLQLDSPRNGKSIMHCTPANVGWRCIVTDMLDNTICLLYYVRRVVSNKWRCMCR